MATARQTARHWLLDHAYEGGSRYRVVRRLATAVFLCYVAELVLSYFQIYVPRLVVVASIGVGIWLLIWRAAIYLQLFLALVHLNARLGLLALLGALGFLIARKIWDVPVDPKLIWDGFCLPLYEWSAMYRPFVWPLDVAFGVAVSLMLFLAATRRHVLNTQIIAGLRDQFEADPKGNLFRHWRHEVQRLTGRLVWSHQYETALWSWVLMQKPRFEEDSARLRLERLKQLELDHLEERRQSLGQRDETLGLPEQVEARAKQWSELRREAARTGARQLQRSRDGSELEQPGHPDTDHNEFVVAAMNLVEYYAPTWSTQSSQADLLAAIRVCEYLLAHHPDPDREIAERTRDLYAWVLAPNAREERPLTEDPAEHERVLVDRLARGVWRDPSTGANVRSGGRAPAWRRWIASPWRHAVTGAYRAIRLLDWLGLAADVACGLLLRLVRPLRAAWRRRIRAARERLPGASDIRELVVRVGQVLSALCDRLSRVPRIGRATEACRGAWGRSGAQQGLRTARAYAARIVESVGAGLRWTAGYVVGDDRRAPEMFLFPDFAAEPEKTPSNRSALWRKALSSSSGLSVDQIELRKRIRSDTESGAGQGSAEAENGVAEAFRECVDRTLAALPERAPARALHDWLLQDTVGCWADMLLAREDAEGVVRLYSALTNYERLTGGAYRDYEPTRADYRRWGDAWVRHGMQTLETLHWYDHPARLCALECYLQAGAYTEIEHLIIDGDGL